MTDTSTHPTPIDAPDRATPHRSSVVLYLLAVAAAAVAANVVARALGADARDLDGSPPGAQVALYVQALIPALAALLAWTLARQRPSWGFRRAPWRSVGVAWVVGLLAVGLPYAAALATGVATLEPDRLAASASGMPVMVLVLIALGPAVLGYAALAVGEQLGWSSFLTVRLLDRRGPTVTAVLVGVAWALFHLPLMLIVPGAVAPGVPTVWAVMMFVGQCVALAFPLVALRHRTGSIWPVVVLHGAFNAVLYTLAEPGIAVGPAGNWLLGEGGALTTVGAVVAVLITRPLWASRDRRS